MSLMQMSKALFDQAFEMLTDKRKGLLTVSELMAMNWSQMAYMIERYCNVNKQTK